MKTLLLNPGPVTLSARVRQAMLGPDLCHRESEFSELQDRLRTALLAVYDLPTTEWACMLLTGSGTVAMEAMISSLLPDTGHLLVIENGVYGERLTRMARSHGISHSRLELAWGAAIDREALARIIDRQDPDRPISHLAIVHHETTTGRLNDLTAIGQLCKQRGIKLLVDAISSFGAEAIDFEGCNIVACAATANKCLHGIPGTAFVIAKRDELGLPTRPRSVYLDLAAYCGAQDRGGSPFTQSVQCFYALDAALNEFNADGGWQARHERFGNLALQVRRGLIALGIRPLLADGESSVVLHAYYLPDGMDYDTLHDGLKKQGFIIYAGQGDLAKRIFRVSTMGDIEPEDMQRLLDAVAGILAGAHNN